MSNFRPHVSWRMRVDIPKLKQRIFIKDTKGTCQDEKEGKEKPGVDSGFFGM